MPLWNMAVFFVYAMRRVDCPTCVVVVERVPWGEGKGHLPGDHVVVSRLDWPFRSVADGVKVIQSLSVCSDMWKPDLNVIAEQIPQALHVLDRFRIMRNMNVAIDEVRRQEVAQLRRDGHEPALTSSCRCLLKRPENLIDNQATSTGR